MRRLDQENRNQSCSCSGLEKKDETNLKFTLFAKEAVRKRNVYCQEEKHDRLIPQSILLALQPPSCVFSLNINFNCLLLLTVIIYMAVLE